MFPAKNVPSYPTQWKVFSCQQSRSFLNPDGLVGHLWMGEWPTYYREIYYVDCPDHDSLPSNEGSQDDLQVTH